MDVHVFVEVLDGDTNRWMVLDPTFGLAAKRAADGGWASAADIASAAVTQDWPAINYVFLTAENDAYARRVLLGLSPPLSQRFRRGEHLAFSDALHDAGVGPRVRPLQRVHRSLRSGQRS